MVERRSVRGVAKGRNHDLRGFYLCDLLSFHSIHLVNVDEYGCNKRIIFKRTGWESFGVTVCQDCSVSW